MGIKVEITTEGDYMAAVVLKVNIQVFMCVASTNLNLQNKVKLI